MAILNEEIISRINCLKEKDQKDFLIWLLEFERNSSGLRFRQEIEEKLSGILRVNDDQN